MYIIFTITVPNIKNKCREFKQNKTLLLLDLKQALRTSIKTPKMQLNQLYKYSSSYIIILNKYK